MKSKWIGIMIFAAAIISAVAVAIAAPTPADTVQVISSSARTDGTLGTQVQALAGNVSLISINETRSTLRWQGYYGNITGAVVLADGNSNKLYDWSLTSPQGEIYASNTSTVAWTSVTCFNFTKGVAEQNITLSMLEGSYGMGSSDVDGVNETFGAQFTGSFQVAGQTIDVNDGCSAAYMNVNNASQSSDFVQVLLTDNSTTNIVYAALLEQDATGFTGDTYDFQMIVGENGDVSGVSSYYFFVELS